MKHTELLRRTFGATRKIIYKMKLKVVIKDSIDQSVEIRNKFPREK